MEIYKTVFIAIDLHDNNSVIGYMNEDGAYINQVQVSTTAQNLVGQVASEDTKVH